MKTDKKNRQRMTLQMYKSNQVKRFHTFRIHCTFMVPVVGHSSNVVEFTSISSHLGRN